MFCDKRRLKFSSFLFCRTSKFSIDSAESSVGNIESSTGAISH